MTDAPSETLLDTLRDRLGPEGFTRDQRLIAPWLTDWRGRYTGVSAALLSPRTVDEVQNIVRICAKAGTPLVPQGGNSSMVGGATPGGRGALLLSLRRMDAIRSVSADDSLLVAEAGVTLSAVHGAAAAVGRRFALSLAAKASATIGGLVSTNAGGTQVLRHGTMRALVVGVEAVLASGERLSGLSALRKDNRGYDVGALMIGAEGTLGVVTAAALRLVPAISARAVAWVGLDNPQNALILLRSLENAGLAIESFELIPAIALALVLRHVPNTRAPLSGTYAWNVLIEAVGSDNPGSPLRYRLEEARREGLIVDARLAVDDEEAIGFWRLRETISDAERRHGPAAKHDISVPVSAMPAFVTEVGVAVERGFSGARVIAFGHLGDGNIHFNVAAPQGSDAVAWLAFQGAEVTRFVHDAVVNAGGSISAEHGIGQMKLDELVRTGDPVRITAQAAIKRALDPLSIMNPGKLVPLARADKEN